MDYNIEQLISSFKLSAETSSKLLQEMLGLIAEGKIPEDASVEELNRKIGELKEKYSSICKAVTEQIPEEELPEKGSSVYTYKTAYDNSAAARYRRLMSEAKQQLEKFISVQSLVAIYSNALAPYQKEAQQLLSQIEKDDCREAEIIEGTAGPKSFLNALECKDFDSEESIEILDKVAEFYPPRITSGLAGGKYVFGETVAEVKLPDEKAKDVPEEISDVTEPDAVEQDNTPDEAVPEQNEVEQEQSTDTAEKTEEPSDTAAEDDENSEFVNALIKHDAFIENDGSVVISREESPASFKKITSSIFMNDIKKSDVIPTRIVLLEVMQRNIVSKEDFPFTNPEQDERLDNAISYLVKKGYLYKCAVNPGGVYYTATGRLIKAMTFQAPCKFIGIKQQKYDPNETVTIATGDPVMVESARVAFVNMHADILRVLYQHDTYGGLGTGRQRDETCSLGVSSKDNSYEHFYGVSVFWTSKEQCDSILQMVKEDVEEFGQISVFAVASFNKEKAKANADVMREFIGDHLKGTRILLYVLPEKKYYYYDTLEEADKDALWVENNNDPDGDGPDETPKKRKRGRQPGKSSAKKKSDTSAKKTAVKKSTEKEEKEEVSGQETEKTDGSAAEKASADAVVETPAASGETAEIIEAQDVLEDVPQDVEIEEEDIGEGEEPVSEQLSQVYDMILSGKTYAAAAYARACEQELRDESNISSLLSYATHDPAAGCVYRTENVYSLIEKRTPVEDALVVAAAVRTFFSDQVRYDYDLKPFYTSIKDYDVMNRLSLVSEVVYSIMEFKNTQQKGLDAYADYHAKDRERLEKRIAGIRKEAEDFYNNYVLGKKKETLQHRRFLEMKIKMFSPDGDIGQCLKSISDGDRDLVPVVRDFLQTNFTRENMEISEESIDPDKMWHYIEGFWDWAGDNIAYRRHEKLMSGIRGNAVSLTTKALQIMAKWCVVITEAEKNAEDAGTAAYRKLKKPLLNKIGQAMGSIEEEMTDGSVSRGEKAALKILKDTLNEIARCMKGTYSEWERSVFYAPFLLTEDILLDENFLPDLNMHLCTIPCLHPSNRVLNHVAKVKNANIHDYKERLRIILNEHGDDYGSAKQIVTYLQEADAKTDYSECEANIAAGKSYAKESTDIKKNDFIGELELAQSYGQIDNSKENLKEKILQIVNEWYDWALETSNYGFFCKVMDAYLKEIRKSARTRGHDLMEQVEAFREAGDSVLTQDQKKKQIEKIVEMIDAQNYTVAEDLLARAQAGEVMDEDAAGDDAKDYLKDFLDNYDDYYKPIATHRVRFIDVINSRARNKDTKGAKKMAENWPTGDGRFRREALTALLGTLGFNIASVKPLPPIGRFENFNVKAAEKTAGRSAVYTHPIAAFGSGATQEGFRVVCITGSYDANGLIDIMKQIGNAKHTLILLDHALTKTERRRLARKTKRELSDKFFGVIDRTVMMYLFKNYEDSRINRILISLIVPFGYYQPYVFESVNVMPSEIFMGRKVELEKIESPTGVNIVYGGRQLGKSALLKKARKDIDRNENNDRAVYIDIKGLSYEKAAKKVSQELYDQGILKEDLETTSWNTLARAIKNRLMDTSEEIPYLLLLMDEADTFIESCESVNYKPFDALKEVQSIGANRFKFVIAGLRNVVRFKREAALGNNSVLTHLQAMTVKPFNTAEARELMEIPLHYLGLRFPKEKESLITLILASTNYFPGLIQLYCAKLIEAMRNPDYAGYNEVDAPVYEVSEKHIKRVLADPEFMQQIREKFLITLKLDEDNNYYLIALIMAYLYHTNGYNQGYTVEDIHTAGTELGITRVRNLDKNKLNAFMEELKDLNVLRSTDETRYLFTRFTFFQMMGTASEVEDKLVEYMEG